MYPDKSAYEMHSLWISEIYDVTRASNASKSEEYWIPSFESLELHFKRTSYVGQTWRQCDKRQIVYPSLTDWGWVYIDNELKFKWDSKANMKKIEKYRKLWSSGCHCKAGKPCASLRCSCKKSGKSCGPGCSCQSNACNNKPVDPSIEALLGELGDEVEFLEIQVVTDDESSDDSDDDEWDIECGGIRIAELKES